MDPLLSEKAHLSLLKVYYFLILYTKVLVINSLFMISYANYELFTFKIKRRIMFRERKPDSISKYMILYVKINI